MANFKVHLSVGTILGIACASGAMLYGIISEWAILVLLVFTIAVGSFLPDVDSDSSTPFKIVFYAISIIFSVLTILWTMTHYPSQLLIVIGLPVATFFIIRFVFGAIFKKFTHHRGIFHSIPMAFVFSFLTLFALQTFSHFTQFQSMALSICIGIGFVGHLILDEIYAATNFNGKKFHPNKNLGSALKFWSHSLPITLLVYILIFILYYITLV
jgi:hypothetical protein